ncbi:MAG: photosynthetic complex putative assembly protein PuhB [Burkholderiales bacterium]
MDGHRHTLGPEHDFEPVPGLPEALPAGERMLWQGSPDVRGLALHAFHVRKVAIYFVAVGAIQLASSLADGVPLREALAALATLAALAAVAVALLATVARLSARTTLYTVTDRRVVMRVGIVLTMTFNIPFSRIASAGLRQYADGTGDLPLALAGGGAIGYAHLWPHARPWRLRRPEPMLRCVPDAARVGRLLADAWAQSTGGAARPLGARVAGAAGPALAPQTGLAPEGRTALAGH